jgi:replicative DNA helicase
MRPKWDKKHGSETYGQMTINRVLSTKANIPNYQEDEALQELQYFEELKKAKAANAFPEPITQKNTVDTNTAPENKSSEKEYYRLIESAAGSMGALDQMITKSANTPNIPTGFSELDRLFDGGLYPGLIIIGAVTSVGKTAVCLQIMDQIAKAGYDVMIFSLEMSKFELMARSISRESFLNDENSALTVRDILDGKKLNTISKNKMKFSNYLKAMDDYKKYADKIFIHEGLGNIRVDSEGMNRNDKRVTVRDKVIKHQSVTGTPPVVLIDYIQLLASKDPRMTDKQAVDYNVMALKQLSRDCNIPVIGISSLNRASYSTRNNNGTGSSSGNNNSGSNSKVALESFKESGAIEYSSDILIGLNRKSDDKNGKAEMEFDILKNRNGRKEVTAEFDYHYVYNCFVEKRKLIFNTNVNTNSNNSNLKKPNAI